MSCDDLSAFAERKNELSVAVDALAGQSADARRIAITLLQAIARLGSRMRLTLSGKNSTRQRQHWDEKAN